MTPLTLVAPEPETEIEQIKDAEHLPLRNGNGGSQSTLPASSDSELQNLNEEDLKKAIKSEWKKHERLAKKDMGPLLYWLREKLRAQGSRNDLRDRDKGFGAWVEETIEISRRTADRWADEYGLANGLMKRKSTSRQVAKSFEGHAEDDFYAQDLRKHGRQIQMNHWVSVDDYQRHKQAVKVLKKHFKTSDTQDAIIKGVEYAAQTLARGRGRTNRSSMARISRTSRRKQKAASTN
jgi:hypothetical protein